MSPESSANPGCGAFRDELLRLACGDIEGHDASSAFEAHLSGCSTCLQELAEAREMVDTLGALLQPEPLRAGLARQIRGELDDRTRPAPRYRLRPLMLIGTAAAAALLAATFIPSSGTQGTTDGPLAAADQIVQSTEDAAAIVAAFNLLDWSDPLDYSLQTVDTTLDELEETISGAGAAADNSVLPWGPEDNWDAPSADAKSPASDPEQPVGFHPEGPHDRLARTSLRGVWVVADESILSCSIAAG